jgi:hypothetical protein
MNLTERKKNYSQFLNLKISKLFVISIGLVGKISAHFKNTPCISYFIKRTPMRFPYFKAYCL